MWLVYVTNLRATLLVRTRKDKNKFVVKRAFVECEGISDNCAISDKKCSFPLFQSQMRYEWTLKA